MKKETLSEAMGINNDWFETADNHIEGIFKKLNRISDVLEESALYVREDCLGEVPLELSDYEKKLLLAGYIAGTSITFDYMKAMSAKMGLSKQLEDLLKKINPE